MNILVCYGTRPELIKINPLIKEFRRQNISFKLLCVKQHTSLIMDAKGADYTVDVPEATNRLDGLLAVPMAIPKEVFEGITHVLVQGDTATALVCSLAEFHRNIKVIHLEAGLRTYDTQNPYPEETYRQIISRVASTHLCPTEDNAMNLKREGIVDGVFIVGNTGLDNLVDLREKTETNNEVLVTLHRRENHYIMDQWFSEVNKIALTHPEFIFTLPIHPNPNVQKYRHLLNNVNVIDPLPYEQFIYRVSRCALIISDSGGIQEEASFLGKNVIVCRQITERPESVGISSFLCRSPEELFSIFELTIKNHPPEKSNLYGNGNASDLIVAKLKME